MFKIKVYFILFLLASTKIFCGGVSGGEEFQVNTYTLENQRSPEVAILDDDGNFMKSAHVGVLNEDSMIIDISMEGIMLPFVEPSLFKYQEEASLVLIEIKEMLNRDNISEQLDKFLYMVRLVLNYLESKFSNKNHRLQDVLKN